MFRRIVEWYVERHTPPLSWFVLQEAKRRGIDIPTSPLSARQQQAFLDAQRNASEPTPEQMMASLLAERNVALTPEEEIAQSIAPLHATSASE